MWPALGFAVVFFFNDTATTEIYTLSLHDALPISPRENPGGRRHTTGSRYRHGDGLQQRSFDFARWHATRHQRQRSEEHTSELQSPCNLVCRLLLEKTKDGIHVHVGRGSVTE